MPGSAASSASSSVTAAAEACQAFSNAAARAAGDEGEALVGLRVEPGDAGLRRGEGRGVDAVTGGVHVPLTARSPTVPTTRVTSTTSAAAASGRLR